MADTPQLFHSSILLLFLTCTLLPFPSQSSTAINGGFTTKLIRHKSPKSPPLFHDASASSSITPENSQFLMKLSVGTPPQNIFAILDSGSDLFWAQCLPCKSCYTQTRPVFDPVKSSTFKEISCKSERCRLVPSGSCSDTGTCNYVSGYGSGGTEGNLAMETVAIAAKSGALTTFENVVFGCGHNNSGTFNPNEMGLIGFGGGPSSFISQVGLSVGGRKFSYCLPPFHTDPSITTTITIGSGSELHGPGVVTVPLVRTPDPTPYFLTITGVSVGVVLVPYSTSGPPPSPNMALDSGTPTTYFPQEFFDRLAAEVKRQVKSPPSGENLCYAAAGDGFAAPPMIVHFDGGVDLSWGTEQTFIRMEDGSFCLAMGGVPDSTGIIGNFAQANFVVGYDLDGMTVSFKPTDCTKFG